MARTIAKDHDQKRAHILKSAAKVFAENGFDRSSMNLLARECGISKANIYHYYDSKDALLFDLLDSKLSELLERIVSVDASGLDSTEALRKTLTEILLAYEGEDYEHQVQNNLLDLLPMDQQKVLRDYQRQMVAHVANLICAARPAVFTGHDALLHATTMSVFGMLNWYYMWKPRATQKDRRDYAAVVTALTLEGCDGLKPLSA